MTNSRYVFVVGSSLDSRFKLQRGRQRLAASVMPEAMRMAFECVVLEAELKLGESRIFKALVSIQKELQGMKDARSDKPLSSRKINQVESKVAQEEVTYA